ncbi:MAG: RpoL/Rpb11 RNA polymerase subunit family protein [Promethearchaeota archaeon]
MDDFDDEFEDDDDILGDYPKVSEKPDKEGVPAPSDDAGYDDDIEEEEEYEIEEEPRFPDYRHLNLILRKGLRDNDFELFIEGQSHGFCNILVKHLLNNENVDSAAYKITGIEPPKIFIRLQENRGVNIKDILFKVIESLRGEVKEVQELFQKLV